MALILADCNSSEYWIESTLHASLHSRLSSSCHTFPLRPSEPDDQPFTYLSGVPETDLG